jgi:hypothetical protein
VIVMPVVVIVDELEVDLCDANNRLALGGQSPFRSCRIVRSAREDACTTAASDRMQ